jgi:hypothetical protein
MSELYQFSRKKVMAADYILLRFRSSQSKAVQWELAWKNPHLEMSAQGIL